MLFAPSPVAEIMSATIKDEQFEGHSLNWWEPASTFKLDSILLSYGTTPEMDIREKLKIPNNVIIIGDSGGYKLLTSRARGKNVNIEPLDVLRWQEKNCEIGLTLDINPTSLRAPGSSREKSIATTSGKTTTDEYFNKCLEETCKNNEIFQNNRASSKLKIYNIIHGGTFEKMERMDIWYNRVKDFKFEGWSVAPKPAGNPLKIAIDLGFLYSRGIKENIHVLAVYGNSALPILVYAKKKLEMKNISTDSFGQALLSIYRHHKSLIGPSLIYTEKNKIHTRVPCFCPVCSIIKNVEDMYRTDNTGYALISLHNTWLTIHFLKYVEALIENEESFQKFVKKYNRLSEGITFLNNTIDYGWEEAMKKISLIQKPLTEW